jgi:tRNA (guanine26-N2/guanine27-N2)-dimethyltransferase
MIIEEGLAKVYVPILDKISSKLPVFYNPLMCVSREISAKILKYLPVKYGIDLMSATGVRGIRYVKEAEKEVVFNDIDKEVIKYLNINLKLNNISSEIYNKDANILCFELDKFDFVDLDPFGSPTLFTPNIPNLVRNKGILLVTATDIPALSGKKESASMRKYGYVPEYSDSLEKEIAVRSLLKHVALNCFRYELGIKPIFCYWHKHHIRVIVQVERKNSLIKENSKYIKEIWTGKLYNKEILKKTLEEKFFFKDAKKVLETAYKEYDTLFFYDLTEIGRELKISTPSVQKIIEELNNVGYVATRTIFSPTGIKTNAPLEELFKLIVN